MTIKFTDPEYHTHLRDLAAWKRPSCADSFGPKERAQGMPGARCTRSLACKK